MIWEVEAQDNSLIGTEPLLFKTDHTQLDKYCKNSRIFLIKPSHLQSPPQQHMQWSYLPALVVAAALTFQRTCGEPTPNPAAEPLGREGPEEQGWTPGRPLDFQ